MGSMILKIIGMLLWTVIGFIVAVLIGELGLFCMVLFPLAYLVLAENRELKEELSELKGYIKKLDKKIDALTEMQQESAASDSCPYRKLVLLGFNAKDRVDFISALTNAGMTFEQACSCVNEIPSVIMEGITEAECSEIMETLQPYGAQMQVKLDLVSNEHNSAWANRNSDA